MSKAKPIPFSQDDLKHLFSYKDGNLYWRKSGSGRRFGVPAGYESGDGYMSIGICLELYRLHRIMWIYHTGRHPENEIDHINRDPSDNRIENLRDVTPSQNLHNRKGAGSNKGGCVGVNFYSPRGTYKVTICVDYNITQLGYYHDFFEACCARKSGELRLSPLRS